jgi:hypothetical protein
LIGLIGPSRIKTGDHRSSDVVAGYVLGAGYLGVLVALAAHDRGLVRQSRDRQDSTRGPVDDDGSGREAEPASGEGMPVARVRDRPDGPVRGAPR